MNNHAFADVFLLRNKSTENNPGFSWDSNPRPSEY